MSLSSRLRAGETVLSAWSSLPEPLTVEILAHSAFDAVTLDMQHGGHNAHNGGNSDRDINDGMYCRNSDTTHIGPRPAS